MLKNGLFKYKWIKYALIKHTLCALYLCSLCSCVLLSALSVLSVPVVHASSRCADLISSSSKEQSASGFSSQNVFDFFASSKNPIEVTKGLQSYIGELLEKQIIEEPQFTRFVESLEKGELVNPISQEEALTSTALLVQHRGLQQYLEETSLDQKELLAWSKTTLEERARVRVSREEAQEETRYQKLEFHPVKRPVRFDVRYMGRKSKKSITLTYPIEVQSTPVTQKQWVDVMGENPSHFAKGDDSVVLTFDGKEVELQPDHPVENVTWWSILVFANRLSEQHGLPPVYDLSSMGWESGTRAEDGTLDYRGTLGKNVGIYVKGKSHSLPYKGDIYYRAEGYRLPTVAEQMYMLRGGKNLEGKGFFKNKADVEKHAWYEDNSGGRTHLVGLLQAMVIDGKDFYDLYGNVEERGWDEHPDINDLLNDYGGKNPMFFSKWDWRFIWSSSIAGGGFDDGSSFGNSALTSQGLLYDIRSPSVGFRLVRTIKPGDSE